MGRVGMGNEEKLDSLIDYKPDKRHRRRSKKALIAIRSGLDEYRSFMAMEKKARGIQPLCRKCARKCKVLNGENSTFVCSDFMEKKK